MVAKPEWQWGCRRGTPFPLMNIVAENVKSLAWLFKSTP